MIKNYCTFYQGDTILSITINHEIADSYIKEMVEFWSGWEARLRRNDNDYTKAFLSHLTLFCLRNDSLPKNDEGWYDFTEKFGFNYIEFYGFDFDEDEIEVEEQ